MSLNLEIFNGICVDTLTGKTCSKGVCLVSGARTIFIGINTLVEIADFLKESGIQIKPDD
jgi:hypothetical protein